MHKISSTGPRLFCIVSSSDLPIYEHGFVTQKESAYLSHFILHSALDLVDELMWKSNNACYLKTVDRYNELYVSAYVTPGNIRFLLLHESKVFFFFFFFSS